MGSLAERFPDDHEGSEEIFGVQFKIKDFRPTLTSIAVKGGMSLLPAMPARLRHANLAATQRSYHAMRQEVAGKQQKRSYRNWLNTT
jgi:integrase